MRVSLTDRECQYIIQGLEKLKKDVSFDYPVIQTGRRVYDDIIEKLQPASPLKHEAKQ